MLRAPTRGPKTVGPARWVQRDDGTLFAAGPPDPKAGITT